MTKRILSLILALCMVLSLSACGKDKIEVIDPDRYDYGSEDDPLLNAPLPPECTTVLSQALHDAGYTLKFREEEAGDGMNFIHPIEYYFICEVSNGETVFFSDFGTEEKAAEHAACYDSTGSNYSSDVSSMIIDYIAPVHFWRSGSFIIEYASETGELMYILNDLYGTEFAGAGSDYFKPEYTRVLEALFTYAEYDVNVVRHTNSNNTSADHVVALTLNGADTLYVYKYADEVSLLAHSPSPIEAPVLVTVKTWTDLNELVAIEYAGDDEKIIELLNANYSDNAKELEVHSMVYYRNGYYDEDYGKDLIEIIESTDELSAYYEQNKDKYGFDNTWLEVCADYTAEWFEGNVLIMAKLIEGSGSNRHEVKSVVKAGGEITVNIERILPEVGTCDMAGWHIMMGISKADYAECEVSLNLITPGLENVEDVVLAAVDVQPIRTDRIGGDASYNDIVVISNFEGLKGYYEKNKELFDLEHKETVYSDTTIGFVDTFETYNEDWFESNVLLMAIVEEGSGSIRHQVRDVVKTAYNEIIVTLDRITPELQTADEACWHIMVGISKADYAGCNVSLDIPRSADLKIEPINAQVIRTDIIDWESSYDEIVVIDNFEGLKGYYEKNKELFDLEHKETVYSDTTIGFVDTFETYNEDWFKSNVLLMAIVDEGSGSIRYQLSNVIKAANGDILINYERIVPELCTDDMACWHIMVGVAKEYYDDLTSVYANSVNVYGYTDDCSMEVTEKPVIYIYPEEETAVSVSLTVDGMLTCTYPKYEDGWQVMARPDGTLTDESGQTYNYLYWEALTDTEYDFSKGFCIKGEDTAEFLESALEKLGLNRREANEFIVYWLPRMEQNSYNIIAFQTDAYTDSAKLEIDPAPDTLIRVFMAWKPAETYTEIEEQVLSAPEREGFTVVEWGGAEVEQTSISQPISYFSQGLMPTAVEEDLWGYVNCEGEFVIEPQFFIALPFASNGLACVYLDGKYGYINTSGEFVIKPSFDTANSFEDDEFAHTNVGYITADGKAVSGNVVPSSCYSEGLARIDVGETWETQKTGYIDLDGNFAIKPQFVIASDFSNGLAAALDGDNAIDGKYGYIDKTGEFVIEPIFDRAEDFTSNGFACVEINGKFGYIDKSGKFVIEPQFFWAESFDSNGLAVVRLNEKYGFINESGEFVIEPIYYYVGSFSESGLAYVRISESENGFINRNGEMVINLGENSAKAFYNGVARVNADGKFGYINEIGEYIIAPRFEDAMQFDEGGFAAVKLDGKWGIIKRNGEFLIKPTYVTINCHPDLRIY